MGYNLLRGMSTLHHVGNIILYHHERYDGKGYPSGLKGESIPLNAQIISVAEAFDAMTVKHAYRDAMTPQQAMKELGQFAGSQFNPDAVKALCMGHIRSRSLNGIKARDPEKKIDYIKKQQEEANTWKINFGKNARCLTGKQERYQRRRSQYCPEDERPLSAESFQSVADRRRYGAA